MIDIKRKYYIIGSIVLFLIITNPSRSAFGSYIHQSGYEGIGRDFNGIIFSVYSDEYYDIKSGKYLKRVYLGALGNFIKISY